MSKKLSTAESLFDNLLKQTEETPIRIKYLNSSTKGSSSVQNTNSKSQKKNNISQRRKSFLIPSPIDFIDLDDEDDPLSDDVIQKEIEKEALLEKERQNALLDQEKIEKAALDKQKQKTLKAAALLNITLEKQKAALEKENKKAAASKQKIAAEKQKFVAEKQKAAAEKQNAFAEKQKAEIENQKAVVQKKKAAIEKQKAAAEKQKAAAEKQRAAAEKQKAADDKQRAALEKQKASIEKLKAAIDEKQKAAAQKEKAAVEKEKQKKFLHESKQKAWVQEKKEPKTPKQKPLTPKGKQIVEIQKVKESEKELNEKDKNKNETKPNQKVKPLILNKNLKSLLIKKERGKISKKLKKCKVRIPKLNIFHYILNKTIKKPKHKNKNRDVPSTAILKNRFGATVEKLMKIDAESVDDLMQVNLTKSIDSPANKIKKRSEAPPALSNPKRVVSEPVSSKKNSLKTGKENKLKMKKSPKVLVKNILSPANLKKIIHLANGSPPAGVKRKLGFNTPIPNKKGKNSSSTSLETTVETETPVARKAPPTKAALKQMDFKPKPKLFKFKLDTIPPPVNKRRKTVSMEKLLVPSSPVQQDKQFQEFSIAKKSKSPAEKSPLTKSPVGNSPLTKSSVGKSPLAKSPIGKLPLTKSPVGKSPLTKSPLTKSPVGKSPTSSNKSPRKTPTPGKLPAKKAKSSKSIERSSPMVTPTKKSPTILKPTRHYTNAEIEAEFGKQFLICKIKVARLKENLNTEAIEERMLRKSRKKNAGGLYKYVSFLKTVEVFGEESDEEVIDDPSNDEIIVASNSDDISGVLDLHKNDSTESLTSLDDSQEISGENAKDLSSPIRATKPKRTSFSPLKTEKSRSKLLKKADEKKPTVFLIEDSDEEDDSVAKCEIKQSPNKNIENLNIDKEENQDEKNSEEDNFNAHGNLEPTQNLDTVENLGDANTDIGNYIDEVKNSDEDCTDERSCANILKDGTTILEDEPTNQTNSNDSSHSVEAPANLIDSQNGMQQPQNGTSQESLSQINKSTFSSLLQSIKSKFTRESPKPDSQRQQDDDESFDVSKLNTVQEFETDDAETALLNNPI